MANALCKINVDCSSVDQKSQGNSNLLGLKLKKKLD